MTHQTSPNARSPRPARRRRNISTGWWLGGASFSVGLALLMGATAGPLAAMLTFALVAPTLFVAVLTIATLRKRSVHLGPFALRRWPIRIFATVWLLLLIAREVGVFSATAYASHLTSKRKRSTSSIAPLADVPKLHSGDAPDMFVQGYNSSPHAGASARTSRVRGSWINCIVPFYKPVEIDLHFEEGGELHGFKGSSAATVNVQGYVVGPLSYAGCLRLLGETSASALE